ncbi:hypothetical protein F5Y11DRAFT_348078 [Daldinia sp. FL1419]|nr:hypothetical protein F5Y11DRAFT_348078 [Daldinia sp. FL1419]
MSANSANGKGRHTVRVGVFIPVECQLLDAAAVDIIGSMGYKCALRVYYSTALKSLG